MKAASTTPAPTAEYPLLIKLSARPKSAGIDKLPRGAERKQAAYTAIVESARQSQQPFVELADKLKASGAVAGYETLVSPNMLVVTPGGGKMMDVLKAFSQPGVTAIYSASGSTLWPAGATAAHAGARQVSGQQWGLDVVRRALPGGEPPAEMPYGIGLIGAPKAWEAGATGKGLVYGSIDTGADFNHQAIAASYRGRNDDGSYSHDYNWFDGQAVPSPQPKDYNGHGTHTIGTVLGKAPQANIGVAPDAKWISAHGLTGDASVRLKSLQWMLAPTRVDGSAADPTKAPDVVGMSWWTAPASEDLFRESIQNLNLAGIEVVKSAGNKGPGPETISSPGQFREINAVAAVDKTGQIADFSSRGPSPLPHTGKSPDWKPDFAAPGVDVVSSVPGNRYASFSGTSMAQPHFSGAVLDILSKYPQLTHDQLNKVLSQTAVDAGARGRDLEFGWGIINLPAALDLAAKTVGAPKPQPTHATR